MLDEQTMNRIQAKLLRVINAIEGELGNQLGAEDKVTVLRPIIHRLIHAELGREAAGREVIAVLDWLDDRPEEGGE